MPRGGPVAASVLKGPVPWLCHVPAMESFQNKSTSASRPGMANVLLFLHRVLSLHREFIDLSAKIRHFIRYKCTPRIRIPKFNTHCSTNDKKITSRLDTKKFPETIWDN
jgi:hypothetical protein